MARLRMNAPIAQQPQRNKKSTNKQTIKRYLSVFQTRIESHVIPRSEESKCGAQIKGETLLEGKFNPLAETISTKIDQSHSVFSKVKVSNSTLKT